ncbi:MAG TPA: hypothetical protein VF526_15500 [Solirubrobacteraceae bacterium]|jgi:hypothetical protein
MADVLAHEGIARRVADQLVLVERAPARQGGGECWAVRCGGAHSLPALFYSLGESATYSAAMRQAVQGVVLAAVEQALALPVPGGTSAGRLAAIREENAEGRGGWSLLEAQRRDIDDLLSHIDHLTRLLHDCHEEGTLHRWSESYALAFAAGAKAQKAIDLAAADLPFADDVRRDVADAPLATPETS